MQTHLLISLTTHEQSPPRHRADVPIFASQLMEGTEGPLSTGEEAAGEGASTSPAQDAAAGGEHIVRDAPLCFDD